tara:strand:+ start:27536 stop:28306 length:771 start_codon:yes stop_codon:yes gene_type:complete
MNVRPKKHLGQHFLTDMSVAERIAQGLTGNGYDKVLEIGPGTGVLTQFLLKNNQFETTVIELDTESVAYLHQHFPELEGRILSEDFLKYDLHQFSTAPFAVAGNFPYNISSQILFKVFDYRDQVPELVGMFQKEVAERVASPPGSKSYGILSVLLQAYYSIEYLFTVSENVFNPPPKVKSGVIRMVRNDVQHLDCDEAFFKTVVKTGFNQRRKTLRNSLKSLAPSKEVLVHELFSQRPEQLSVDEFVQLAQMLKAE